jgi:hypothetical protein
MRRGTSNHWTYFDALGSVAALGGSGGGPVETHRYMPFGRNKRAGAASTRGTVEGVVA